MLTPSVRKLTVRGVRMRPRRSTQEMKPCMPPDAWVKVIIPPISELNRRMRALSGEAICSM